MVAASRGRRRRRSPRLGTRCCPPGGLHHVRDRLKRPIDRLCLQVPALDEKHPVVAANWVFPRLELLSDPRHTRPPGPPACIVGYEDGHANSPGRPIRSHLPGRDGVRGVLLGRGSFAAPFGGLPGGAGAQRSSSLAGGVGDRSVVAEDEGDAARGSLVPALDAGSSLVWLRGCRHPGARRGRSPGVPLPGHRPRAARSRRSSRWRGQTGSRV